MPAFVRSARRALSRARLQALAAVGVRSGQRCPACARDVPGFYFMSYRPFGCPHCRSSPRERFVVYALEHGLVPPVPAGGRVLHVAPIEANLVRYFKARGEWVGGDLDPTRYGPEVVRLDLTAIDLPGAFDVIYASHVLEHIPDDAAAMRQLCAALTPGGYALVLVPLRGAVTEEGGALSAHERRRRFGHPEHVRQYGADIVERLAAAGFAVEVVDARDTGPEVIRRHGFETHGYAGDAETDRIFVCRRPR